MDNNASRMRKRAANFTKNEVVALLYLIDKYKKEVESRGMDTNSHVVKEVAWQKIANEFNALPQIQGNFRDAHVLRNKYSNFKKRQNHKRKLKLAEKNGSEDVDFGEETSRENFMCETDEVKEEVFEEEDVKFSETDSTSNLFDEISYVNEEEKRDVINPEKLDFLELQKTCLLKEHEMKMRHMTEMHNKALKIQEEEAEEKLRQMREQHKLQMEILKFRRSSFLT